MTALYSLLAIALSYAAIEMFFASLQDDPPTLREFINRLRGRI